MNVKSVALLLAGALSVSCNVNQDQSQANARGGGKTLAGAADASKAGPAKGAARPSEATAQPVLPANATEAVDVSEIPPAPKEAQWTLYCATFKDASHVETSREMKNWLAAQTKMNEWYIIHENTQSRLYYGYYRSIADATDAAETARAKADRQKIAGLSAPDGRKAFRASQFVQLAAPDPDAPPQWNLVNAPTDKFWTLMIGAYKDSPDRKRLAVEAVREAREKYGEEAYYYHGDTVSNVFVGTWPAEAVVEERVDAKKGVHIRRDPLLVLPPGMRADGAVRNKQGAVRAVGVTYKPVDPTLLKKIGEYPSMGVNGEFLTINVGGRKRLEGCKVIQIPRPSDRNFADNAVEREQGPNPDDPVAAAPVRNLNDDQAGELPPEEGGDIKVDPGVLRSIGRKKN